MRKVKSRICVCVFAQDQFKKLAWANEDRRGVYFGMYQAGRNGHFSYHADGRSHAKSQKGTLLWKPTAMAPIFDIKGAKQLWTVSLPVVLEFLQARDNWAGDAEASTIYVPRWIMGSVSVLNVHLYLLHNHAEAEFVGRMQLAHDGDGFTLLALTTSPLLHFPEHKVAIVVNGTDNQPHRKG